MLLYLLALLNASLCQSLLLLRCIAIGDCLYGFADPGDPTNDPLLGRTSTTRIPENEEEDEDEEPRKGEEADQQTTQSSRSSRTPKYKLVSHSSIVFYLN